MKYKIDGTGTDDLYQTVQSTEVGAVVLNVPLYTALRNVFQNVGITNNGVPFTGRVVVDAENRVRTNKIAGGEEYHVNCPVCGDSRQRLYINHRWNTRFEGHTMWHLITCHNEHCEREPGFRRMVWDQICQGTPIVSQLNTNVALNLSEYSTQKPGKLIRVDKLPEDHVAVRYLSGIRKLPVKRLGEIWDVSWCEYSLALPPNNRLFFPIMVNDEKSETGLEMMGGQAHWLDVKTLSGKPDKSTGGVKWYTLPGTKASQLLYNGHIASRQKDLIVIVEGAFDVMRIGELAGGEQYAVGIFGHTVSEAQKELLWNNWGKHGATAILALDPDVYTGSELGSVKQLETWFSEKWNSFHSLRLTGDRDIGAMDTHEVWDILTAGIAAAQHNTGRAI